MNREKNDMIKKKILIQFANPTAYTADNEHFYNIREAVDAARFNLMGRHHITVSTPTRDGHCVYLELNVPDNTKSFDVGRRLRGISDNLIKQHPDIYRPLRVGTRLLYYVEIST